MIRESSEGRLEKIDFETSYFAKDELRWCVSRQRQADFTLEYSLVGHSSSLRCRLRSSSVRQESLGASFGDVVRRGMEECGGHAREIKIGSSDAELQPKCNLTLRWVNRGGQTGTKKSSLRAAEDGESRVSALRQTLWFNAFWLARIIPASRPAGSEACLRRSQPPLIECAQRTLWYITSPRTRV